MARITKRERASKVWEGGSREGDDDGDVKRRNRNGGRVGEDDTYIV